MRQSIVLRVITEAEFIIENKSTLRATAKVFKLGKSTIHKDMTIRLKQINKHLYNEVRKILDVNLSERHIRGGLSTKLKFEKDTQK